jgi:hypothetical protein
VSRDATPPYLSITVTCSFESQGDFSNIDILSCAPVYLLHRSWQPSPTVVSLSLAFVTTGLTRTVFF